MTFKLKDVRPKTGPVINVKPYQGIKRYGNINPRVIKNERAIARMRETRDAQS